MFMKMHPIKTDAFPFNWTPKLAVVYVSTAQAHVLIIQAFFSSENKINKVWNSFYRICLLPH